MCIRDQQCNPGVVMNATDIACVSGQCKALCAPGWDAQGSCSPVAYTTAIVLAHSLNTPQDIVADADYVYWTDTGDSSVWQVSNTGGTPQPIATAQTNPAYMDIDATHVYWLTPTGINRVLKGGGTVETVVPVANPQGLVATGGGAVHYVAGGTFY